MSHTLVIFCLLSFTLTIDYSISLISAEAYWVSMGGNDDLSGIIFGLYDASTIIITPILAIYIGKGGSYKLMFICGLIINMLGNAVYALAYLASSWKMIVIGRTMSGIGSTVLPLLMVYVTDNIESSMQITAVGYIKYVSAVSRIIGPVIASLLTFTVITDGIVSSIFNMYTLVGWIPIIMDIITLLAVLIYFEETVPNEDASNTNQKYVSISDIIYEFYPILTIGFVSTFIYWAFMGNSFIIATHHFHILNNEHDLWRIYVSGCVGFVISFVAFLLAKQFLSELYGLVLSIVLLTCGSYVYLASPDWAFYVAVGISTFAYGLMIPSVNILNNTLAKKNKTFLGKYMAITISLLTVIGSLARFAGPAMFTVFTTSDIHNNCNFSNKDNYNTSGCTVDNYIASNTSYITIAFVLMILSCVALYNRLKCENDSRPLLSSVSVQK